MRVEMRSIEKRFGATKALDRVDFTLEPGQIHAILGENGAGKSTLMHVLAGLTAPDSGEIRIDSRVVRLNSSRDARKAGIAMVHQHFALVPAFTVAENLALDLPPKTRVKIGFLEKLRYSAAKHAEHGLDRARSLGWALSPDAFVGSLPVGTQQRVEIAKALASEADVLIFDEPTSVLTPDEVSELFAVLRSVRAEGRSIVLIAHKLLEVLAVADRITVLRHGQAVKEVNRADTNATELAGWMMGAGPGQETHSDRIQTTRNADTANKNRSRLTSGKNSCIDLHESGSSGFRAAGLSVSGDRGQQAIRDVSFAAACGEILGIGGVDGNGQTELAEALVGLRPIRSGSLLWKDREFAPGHDPVTGYIPPDRRRSGLAVTMTVEENLILDAVDDQQFRQGPFLRRRALNSMASGLMERYDIRAQDLNVPVSSLSGGNQQKIVVARALRSDPEWIVAMNPTRGLDLGAAEFVWSQLRAAAQRGAAIVLISTDLDEISLLSDRAAILSGGSLTAFELSRADTSSLGMALGGAVVVNTEHAL